MFVVEVAICAKFTDGRTDRQTDGRRTPRDCISSWNELMNMSIFRRSRVVVVSQSNRNCNHGLSIQKSCADIATVMSISKVIRVNVDGRLTSTVVA